MLQDVKEYLLKKQFARLAADQNTAIRLDSGILHLWRIWVIVIIIFDLRTRMATLKTTERRNACPVCGKPRGAGTNHGKCVETLAAAEPKRKKMRTLKGMIEDIKFFETITENNKWRV